MRVVVAPDKFKGCLPADEVADAVAQGLLATRPQLEVERFPVADGGDGTVAAALSRGFDAVELDAHGPTGAPVRATYARRHAVAVIELAAICGLGLLPQDRHDPLGASTFGLGEAVRHAVDGGATRLLLGVGGSASTDGGAGMVEALGARLLDAAGEPVGRGARGLLEMASLDLAPMRSLLEGVEVRVASDVDNPLLGPRGAASVFGPQKGADPDEVETLERSLDHWSHLVAATVGADATGRPGAGAAGGTGFAAIALLGAELSSGIELVLDLLGFDTAIDGADLVITGEGALDEQSLAGKAPMGVARAAGSIGVPVVAVAGISDLSAGQLAGGGIRAVYRLSDLQPDPRRSIAEAATLLRRIGQRIAQEWCPS